MTIGISAIKIASTNPRPTKPQNPSLVRSSSLSILPSNLASEVLICPLISEKPTRISRVKSVIALVLASVALAIDSTAVLISLISVSVAYVMILGRLQV